MTALDLATSATGRRVALVARRRLRRLDHRLDRSWRRALVERDLHLLGTLRRRVGTPLVAVTATTGNGIVAAELTFGDGSRLRLGPCHRPAVGALADAVATSSSVTLCRARRCGRLWVLDFDGPQDLTLLARAISEPGGGSAPMAPGPSHGFGLGLGGDAVVTSGVGQP